MVLTLTMFLGCASTSNNIQQQHALHSELLASDVDSLATTYDTVKALVDEKQIKDKIFNDKDWDKLLDVDASINLLLLKYKVIVKADITEKSSMRLFVVLAKPPLNLLMTPLKLSLAAQPPGPGLPRQEPSVKMITV